jgi:hypothetical protein
LFNWKSILVSFGTLLLGHEKIPSLIDIIFDHKWNNSIRPSHKKRFPFLTFCLENTIYFLCTKHYNVKSFGRFSIALKSNYSICKYEKHQNAFIIMKHKISSICNAFIVNTCEVCRGILSDNLLLINEIRFRSLSCA